MAYKKQVLDLQDKDGLFTLGVKTKEEALKLMKEWWDEDKEFHPEYYGAQTFSLDKIKEERVYEHRACHFFTIGENWCLECGEQSTGNGTPTFTFYFRPDIKEDEKILIEQDVREREDEIFDPANFEAQNQ